MSGQISGTNGLIEQLSTTMMFASDGVIMVDHENKIFSLNHCAEKILSVRNREAKGKELEEIFRVENQDCSDQSFRMTEGRIFFPEKNSEKIIEYSCQPLFTDDKIFSDHSHHGSIILFREKKKSPSREILHNEDYKKILNSYPDIIAVILADGTIGYVSHAVKRTLGYDPKEMINCSADNFIHKMDIPEAMSFFKTALRNEKKIREFRFRHKDGTWKIVEVTAGNISLRERQAIVIKISDVTEKKLRETLITQQISSLELAKTESEKNQAHLNHEIEILNRSNKDFTSAREKLSKEIIQLVHTNNNFQSDKVQLNEKLAALLKKNTELSRSNSELEQFAYVASDDLQEPLRMIASYTQLLAQRYKGKLDKDADDFINYAVDGANRMQELINDLLSYSRVNTVKREYKLIELDTVLDRALSNLAYSLKEYNAEVETMHLPIVLGDMLQLTQVFQNIIGNAIKFKSDKPPKIVITSERQGSKYIISIKDNGIGFKQQYKERIFVIFQRLHSKKDYPGTGIGLAICKKIIENHGGNIWVESEPGTGSTFYLSFPATE